MPKPLVPPHVPRTVFVVLLGVVLLNNHVALAQEKEIPPPLQPWKNWVLWGEQHPNCPTPFNAGDQHICSWPARLTLQAQANQGGWQVQVRVYEESWVSLPGDSLTWPLNVRANGEPIPVLERDGEPAVRLPAGLHDLAGEFRWNEMPQWIAVPQQIGILTLVVNGQTIPIPNWDASGHVWLQRVRAPETERDLLAAEIYRVVEDGIPMWLRTQIDLTVSGRSREEQLGALLPEGWQLSLVDSPIPVAVDEQGQMKAQVRAGTWTVQVDAFRNTDLDQLQYVAGAQRIKSEELIGFRAQPDFRIAEFEGVQPVDVSQTTFPDRWRGLPVFQWQTDSSVRLVQKMRGMGMQQPPGLTIDRHFWLDENGGGITFRDRIAGQLQRTWRLDVAPGQELGAVRVDGESQLITTNPQSGAHGVEIRDRNLNVEAIGRIDRTLRLPATGWQTDAESLRLTLQLPPGWRVFALFGADQVEGDWLTAWTLLDLFLLLIFSMAVLRLWGIKAGILALLAYGLAYHEPGAPRVTWLVLLIPLALLRVVGQGSARRWVNTLKYIALALLLLNLIPFVARQVQSAIYPQLETTGVPYREREMFEWLGVAYRTGARVADYAQEMPVLAPSSGQPSIVTQAEANLKFEPTAKIQTGPAEPQWQWNEVYCIWSGPVSQDQPILPVLISRPVHRFLTVVRVLLLLLLAAVLLGTRSRWSPLWRRPAPAAAAVAALLVAILPAASVWGQIPDQQMLDTLRERLLQPPDVYPHAADIAAVHLAINEGRVSMQAEVHAAIEVAVPLPGRLPAWSPLSVSIDGQADALVCRREDGYLWVLVPPGVHQVVVEGWLAEATEWEWTFLLTPRRVAIDAPGWNVTGVRPNGVPENQVFMTRLQPDTEGGGTYDQKNYRAIVAVERHLEVGLLWKVHNTVTRLSAPGRAVSVQVPLLSGENVLTSNVVVANRAIEVNLGANQEDFRWESELQSSQEIRLDAAQTAQWVERWFLISSPVWNVTSTGLAPIYQADQERLIPVWHPWPGEGVTLAFRQPEAVLGATMTTQSVRHEVELGARQRDTTLQLQVESSLGNDFVIEFDEEADVKSLTVAGQSIPVQRDGRNLIVPVRPGTQSVEVVWSLDQPLTTVAPAGEVTLPVEGSNVTTVMHVPEDRWILWAGGPLRGPAVRFWTIVVLAILMALALGSIPQSPLRRYEWVLLALGLTQIHVAAAMLVVGWLFLLAWRGKRDPEQMIYWRFNLLQLVLVFLTIIVLGVFIVIVQEGLLGQPEMFILGNGSWYLTLNWYQPRAQLQLPEPYIVSVSIWFYRALMLAWALWLAIALLRWLQNGWTSFSHGGCWKHAPRRRTPPVVAERADG